MRSADGVSLRQLADEVGVPLFLLYRFLTTKENKPLYKEALDEAAHKFMDDADEAARDQRRSTGVGAPSAAARMSSANRSIPSRNAQRRPMPCSTC